MVLESDPNDIKPRRVNREDDKPGNKEHPSTVAKNLSTEMELLGTVSRSGGLGDENDAYVNRPRREGYMPNRTNLLLSQSQGPCHSRKVQSVDTIQGLSVDIRWLVSREGC